MKNLRLFGIAVLAGLVFSVGVGAGTASATVLCKTLSSPCTGGDYASETKIESVNTVEPVLENLTGTEVLKCRNQAASGKLSSTGGATATPVWSLETLTFAECLAEVATLQAGSIEIHYTSGGNGTLTTAKSVEWTYQDGLRGKCSYSTGAGTDVGVLKGGSEPLVEVSAVGTLFAGGAACWMQTRWTDKLKVTTPTPLFVAAS
jgi:hypothetical protein